MTKLLFLSKDKDATYSSMVVSRKGFNILINATENVLEQIKEAKVDHIDAILMTSAAEELVCGIPDFSTWTENDIPLYGEESAWREVINRREKRDRICFESVYPDKTLELADLRVTPFRTVIDNTQALGYRIGGIVYAGDLTAIPPKSEPYFQNAEVLVFGAVSWFGADPHKLCVDSAITIARKCNASSLYFAKDETFPSDGTASTELRKYIKENQINFPVALTHNGLVISKITHSLSESRTGLMLTEPIAKSVWNHPKKYIVTVNKYPAMIGKPIYFMSGSNAYGIIKITEQKDVGVMEFRDLVSDHGIGEMTRKKLWGNNKRYILNTFEFVEKFPTPRPIAQPETTSEIVPTFKFEEELSLTPLPEPQPATMDETALTRLISHTLQDVLEAYGIKRLLNEAVSPFSPFIPMHLSQAKSFSTIQELKENTYGK